MFARAGCLLAEVAAAAAAAAGGNRSKEQQRMRQGTHIRFSIGTTLADTRGELEALYHRKHVRAQLVDVHVDTVSSAQRGVQSGSARQQQP